MKRQNIILILSLVLSAQTSPSAARIGGRLAGVLHSTTTTASYSVWVTFADKGPSGLQKCQNPSALVSERSLTRRRNVLSENDLVDYSDVPVEEKYLEGLRLTGALLRHQSKWFNAASISATPDQIAQIALLPFVREIELLGMYGTGAYKHPADAIPVSPASPGKPDGTHTLDYGPSANQLLQINVPAIHDLGNHAEGVIVGVFDNGFRLPNHEALASMNIIATRDFVDHKVSVVPNNPATNFGDHGINTLSTIGGYKPGQLIGPAFGASFILARTENDSSETPVEEDNWLAAIEWADSIGVQVTSTSLGYCVYDAPYVSWTWENMDGRTTLITRAAAMAVRKGIVVLNSAGNEGFNATRNTLGAPSDADSVIAVGAVALSGLRTGFSSVGPSTSVPPRIKPDVMALGTGVYIASATNATGYSPYGQGTSFSCPLAAGVAALLVKARPTAAPMDIVNAMRQTASNASTPNNSMGWGIINATAALNHLISTDTNIANDIPAAYGLEQNFPNPFNPATTIRFDLQGPEASHVRLAVYDMLGREVSLLINTPLAPGHYQWSFNANGLASGVYFYRLEASNTGGSFRETKRLVVLR